MEVNLLELYTIYLVPIEIFIKYVISRLASNLLVVLDDYRILPNLPQAI